MSAITLKDKELERLIILRQVQDGKLSQVEASARLQVSTRHMRRLVKRFKLEGTDGVKSRKKGGQRAFKSEFKNAVMKHIAERYNDFGPTFASEKLAEYHNLNVNKETLRQWMKEANLWKSKARKKARIHQSRERRSRFGELVQIDGSDHDWFEGRAPKCCLLVFIDDATSRILALRFEKAETTFGYMRTTLDYVKKYGRPCAFYSDKHSIFKTTRESSVGGLLEDTQFCRAVRELGIELICAHSSQAKGRVERANQTLQDRLIKEMRLRGISTIEEANVFALEFIEMHNRKFSIDPTNCEDAHRALNRTDITLKRIFSIQSKRKTSKNLEISFKTKIHQIQTKTTGYRLRFKEITIHEHIDGTVELLSDGLPLEYKVFSKDSGPREADSKEINELMDGLLTQAIPPINDVSGRQMNTYH